MLRIGLYGGSFNPIGKHHVNIARRLINKNIVDEIWLMPCNVSLNGKKLIDAKHRLSMCQLASENCRLNNIKVSDFEIKHKLSGNSYQIMQKFFEIHKLNKFYFIIGADNAINIDRWQKSDKLLKLVDFVVVPRPGIIIEKDSWCRTLPHMYLEDLATENYSSTMIRNDISMSNNSTYLDEEVLDYIKINKLFTN